MRRIAILAEGAFGWHSGKTSTGVIRYGKEPVVAVIDSTKAGQDVSQALGASFGKGIPIVKDIHEVLTYQPDTLLIGIAPMGGALPEAWRWQLLAAIEAGLNLVSGLHFFLADDEELRSAAARRGVEIWDVRRPPETKRVGMFRPHRPGSHTVLMVGSDCAAGKMTVALELDREARARGWSSAFLATGQTGILIAGGGIPADRIISDFLAGEVEQQVLDLTNKHDWVFVEGQGALNHPGYSPVTLGLIHGSMPEAMIFCHHAGATAIDGLPHAVFPSLKRLIHLNEETVNILPQQRPSKVVGIALVTSGLNDQQAQEAIARIEDETGLPATDVWRFGVGKLMDALHEHATS
ncbi:MAG TPA: DUF1611 domain-containing protein [Ktedonobacteraceae bacterium]|nr:DUF1611 domain-containing protein [Ktedonobacteraceae bacterium]